MLRAHHVTLQGERDALRPMTENDWDVLARWGFEDEGADMIFGCGVADYNLRSRRAFEKVGYGEAERVQEAPGSKAQWSIDLALSRDDDFRRQRPNRTAGGTPSTPPVG